MTITQGPSRGSVFGLLVRFRYLVILAVVAVTALLGSHLGQLQLDPDVEAYVPMHHPVRAYWIEAEKRFILRDQMLVAVVADGPEGVFTPEILAGISDLAERIESLDYVLESEVRSIARAEAIVGSEDSLDVVRFYQEPPADAAEALAIRRSVFANPVYLDRLISRDAGIAVLLFRIDRYRMGIPATYDALRALVADHQIAGTRILIAGKPAIEAVYGRQMAADLEHLIPLTLLAVALILYGCFPTIGVGALSIRFVCAALALVGAGYALSRSTGWLELVATALAVALLSVPGVILPSLVVVLALVWTWGIQACLGAPIYIAAIIMPPILLAIGCADGIHILERYADLVSTGTDRRAAVVRAMELMWRPVVLTSLTTAAGFAALMSGDMTAYKSLGAFTSVGIIAAMVLSLTLIPALLAVLLPSLDHPVYRVRDNAKAGLSLLVATIRSHRRTVMAAGTVLMVGALLCAASLRVDSSWVESLQEGTEVLTADRILRTRLGGTVTLNVIVDSGEDGGIKRPEVLRAMDDMLADISLHDRVGDTRSLAEYVKRMNQALHADDPAEYRIPDDPQLVAQLLLLYSMSGDPGELDDTVDYAYREANMWIHMRDDHMAVMSDVIARTQALAEQRLRPLGLKATLTGSAMMHNTVQELIFQGQVYSLSVATVLVFAMLWGLYRSVAYALVGMLPPAFAGVTTFGTMGLLGIALGPSEAVIAAIALGIGIDYSIHMISRVREQIACGQTMDDAIDRAIITTGRGVLYNAVVVVAGFSLLAFSRSPSNVSFGLLIASNMATCCIAALVFLPALLSYLGEAGRLPLADTAAAGASLVE